MRQRGGSNGLSLRDWKSCPIYDYILRDNNGYKSNQPVLAMENAWMIITSSFMNAVRSSMRWNYERQRIPTIKTTFYLCSSSSSSSSAFKLCRERFFRSQEFLLDLFTLVGLRGSDE